MATATFSYTPAQVEVFYDTQDYKYLVVPKGRRCGMTKGAELAFIEYALDGLSPLLWVDTINGNIDRYFERYFIPDLKKLPVKWDWNAQKKILKIRNSIIDFRSADTPQSIEGFGYKVILLNEAGIILKDPYLYKHAIVPMLLDYPDSRLIAIGTPKGKHLKNGDPHPYYQLQERALSGGKGYKTRTVTSFENPFLQDGEIRAMINEMTELEARQEIYGEFVEFAGNNPFAHQYRPDKHESKEAVFRPGKQIVISLDFNIDPFAVTFSHIWKDNQGHHTHIFDEMEIKNGSIPLMIEKISQKYGRHLQSALMTGDAMGKAGQISERDNASLYKQLLRGLGMSTMQLKVSGNPTHENSRADVNAVLLHLEDFKINPDTCPNTCRDMRMVQCDSYGEIQKKNRNDVNQRSDMLDTIRYLIHNLHRQFLAHLNHGHRSGVYS